MEVEGTIVMELPMQEGVSKAGRAWKKREWVLETTGMYPRKVKFHVFGDRADTIGLEVGKAYALSFDIESREFNGRWYTDISVFGARPLDGSMAQPSVQAAQANPGTFGNGGQFGNMGADPLGSADNTDDLPF